VRAILTDVQSDDDFVIRVSESDAETLRAVHPALLDLVGRDAGLRIEVDSRLLSGGTVVETSYGKIDASIEQQLEAFAAGVEAWVTTEVEANDD
jgi:flagellar biosynthesis/type III secretory pathway protein FliH